MKRLTHVARILVGSLFVFSGLVKAIDPKGLSYKMEEFFEVWASDHFLPSLMNALHEHSAAFSVVMITLEVVLGVALLVGWQKKITSWLLLLLVLFFTFLTSYVLFSGKIRACGCFGDCIPLTPIQTFTKDLLLLVLVLVLLFQLKYINPLPNKLVAGVLVLISLLGVLGLQWYVMKHLPVKDCLPYRAGNNILKLREMPANAIPDQFDYLFLYKKGDVTKEFTAAQLPDSTWTYVDRKQMLIKKGSNNVPVISDFSLTDSNGVDVTDTVLSQPQTYYLLFLKNLEEGTAHWSASFVRVCEDAAKNRIPVYVVSSEVDPVKTFLAQAFKGNVPPVLSCDGTAIKTAARVAPTLFVMKGPVVQAKYSYADMEKTVH